MAAVTLNSKHLGVCVRFGMTNHTGAFGSFKHAAGVTFLAAGFRMYTGQDKRSGVRLKCESGQTIMPVVAFQTFLSKRAGV